MQVTILAVILNGKSSLSLHRTQSAAWDELMSFIDERWPERMGSIEPAVDGEIKARAFFRQNDGDLYAIIDADVSELHEALASVSDAVVG